MLKWYCSPDALKRLCYSIKTSHVSEKVIELGLWTFVWQACPHLDDDSRISWACVQDFDRQMAALAGA